MTDQTPTRTGADRVGYTRSDDGTVFVTLTLFPDELTAEQTTLSGLADAADRAHEAYERGGEDFDEVGLATLALGPLASVLRDAASTGPAPIRVCDLAWAERQLRNDECVQRDAWDRHTFLYFDLTDGTTRQTTWHESSGTNSEAVVWSPTDEDSSATDWLVYAG